MPAPGPTVEPTGRTALMVAAILGAGVTWIGLSIAENFGWPVPVVPPLTALVVGLLALATWLAARWTHRTVQVRRDPIEPSLAVGLLLAGKAALIGGTALAGGYAAIALRSLPNLDAALPRDRVITSAAVALLSVGLAVAGWALERACQVPPPPDDESSDAPGADTGGAASPG
jgi:apolipoprotein N-acyltransferase